MKISKLFFLALSMLLAQQSGIQAMKQVSEVPGLKEQLGKAVSQTANALLECVKLGFKIPYVAAKEATISASNDLTEWFKGPNAGFSFEVNVHPYSAYQWVNNHAWLSATGAVALTAVGLIAYSKVSQLRTDAEKGRKLSNLSEEQLAILIANSASASAVKAAEKQSRLKSLFNWFKSNNKQQQSSIKIEEVDENQLQAQR